MEKIPVAGRFDQDKRSGGKQGPDSEQEQEQEQEARAQEDKQPEHARMQQQMGNQALLSMLGNQGASGGGGGVEVEGPLRTDQDTEKDTPQLGGDDDPVDPGPLTVQDLSQTWNPGIKRSKDRPGFVEPMPDDELPPEDESFLDTLAGCPEPLALPPLSSGHHDALLQPSPDVVRVSLTEWARAAGTWAAPTLTSMLLARLVAPAAPLLQDPHGRVLLSRARSGAIANALLLASPRLAGGAGAGTSTALDFCLELAARRHRVRTVQVLTEDDESDQLPVALEVFSSHAPDASSGGVLPRRPTEGGAAALRGILERLTDFDDPDTLVPELQPLEPPEDPDDPLGLDEVIESFTGGAVDHEAPIYDAAIQAAERLAATATRSRVRYAGAGVALGEVAALWSAGTPTADLERAMSTFDRDIASCLQLLVEIARAAQRRSVPPRGLHNGLKRAARSLAKTRRRGHQHLMEIAWGILPGDPDLAPTGSTVPDELRRALADGRPLDALPWLQSRPASLDRDTAIVLLRALAGQRPTELREPLRAVRARWQATGDVPTIVALSVILGAVHLSCGDARQALAVSDWLLEHGRRRRNGLLVAEGALLGVEVHHDSGDAEAGGRLRRRAGHLLWRMGARGALSLLARWRPPEFFEHEGEAA